MKFLFLDVYKEASYRISKDTAGGYGTANDLGDGIFGKILSRTIRYAVDWPNLSFANLMQQLIASGHECQYVRINSAQLTTVPQDYQGYFICNSIVCYETEIYALNYLSKVVKSPIFLCGTVARFAKPILPLSAMLLSGNYEFINNDFFRTRDSMIELLSRRTMHIQKPAPNQTSLAPIEWGSCGLMIPKNRILGGRKIFIPYLFNRGCPYSCSAYCTYPTTQGKQVFSPEIEQCIDSLRFHKKKFGSLHVVFRDPVFSINLQHTKELINSIIEADLDVEFSAELHLKNIDSEFLELAKQANFRTLKFGVESAFDHIRKAVSRVSVSNDEQFEKIQEIRSYGIRTLGMFILGHPTDNLDTCRATIKYASKLKLDIAQFSVFTPYPGTSYYEEIKDRILATSYEEFNQFQLIYEHPSITPLELRKLLESAYKKFLLGKISFN